MAKLQHVLCIDDDPDILEVAKMCLEATAGLQVTCLSDSKDALVKAEGIKPDLILLDVMMPQMDGPSTLRALRRNPALDNVPIVFMTARVRDVEVNEYLAIGATGIIEKPFDPMTLAVQVEKIWGKAQAE